MNTTMESIDVEVPITTAYNQWTQVEDFPQFMSGVDRVEQIDDTHSRWHTTVLGQEREFDTRITEQLPDERIAWTTTHGEVAQAGVVTFHRLDADRTRLTVQMDVEPDGLIEKLGAATGAIDRQVKGDLKRFKEFVEGRGAETGAWRGQVDRAKP